MVNLPLSTSEGNFRIKASISRGGEIIADSYDNFTVNASFDIISVPQNIQVELSATATTYIVIKNTSNINGLAELRLKCGDLIDKTTYMYISSGTSQTASFTFQIADDLEKKAYTGIVDVLNRNDDLCVRKSFPLYINGYDITVTAGFDREPKVYSGTETSHLSINVINNNQNLPPTIFAKVNTDGYSCITATEPVSESTTLEFDIPISSSVRQRVFYGIYADTGRSIYLNNEYLYRKNEYITIWSDKNVYYSSETMTIYLQPSATGQIELAVFGSTSNITFEDLAIATTQYIIPQDITTGIYPIEYTYIAASTTLYGSFAFDVFGYTLKVLDCFLNSVMFRAGDDMVTQLWIVSDKNIDNALIKGWIYKDESLS